MSRVSIADQVHEFNTGFTAQIGPELSEVFAREQRDLIESGAPDGVVVAGDSLPDADLLDADGVPRSLHAAIGDEPAVVVFYRGAWCPYCNLTLRTYQTDLAPVLRERGIALIAISPQTPEGTADAMANGELDFTVLSDPSATLIRELGILTEPSADARGAHTALGFDVADSNADATAGIPFPTVLVVDSQKRVRFAEVQVDYTSRTEVPTILSAIESLLTPID